MVRTTSEGVVSVCCMNFRQYLYTFAVVKKNRCSMCTSIQSLVTINKSINHMPALWYTSCHFHPEFINQIQLTLISRVITVWANCSLSIYMK